MKASPPIRIRRALDDATVERCLPALLELRPHLTPAQCRKRLRRQLNDGFHLVLLELDHQVEAVAGYRLLENLAWGRFMYVDDLVTRARSRNQGLGRRLLSWLLREARKLQCAEFHLDSGVQRHPAHRFYLNQRLRIVAHHFARPLT